MASGNEMKPDTGTYNGFIGWVKWATIFCALLTALVVYILA